MASTSASTALRAAIINDGRSMREIAKEADLAHTLVAKFAAGGDIRLSSAEALAKVVGLPLIAEDAGRRRKT